MSLVLAALFATGVSSARSEEAGVEFFEKKIRPVLVEQCYKCHSAEAARLGKLRGGLQLDTREGIRKGGTSGPSVVLGDPKKSLLVEALRHGDLRMPPKQKLPARVIGDFVAWIENGAPDPRDGKSIDLASRFDLDRARKHWAYRPVENPRPPELPEGTKVAYDIDRFVVAKLLAKGLRPAASVSANALLRRLTYDLTGLPPAPEQLDAFLAAYRVDPDKAVAEVVEELLASPRFGEQWARHWLDGVRFDETLDRDVVLYRDWVVRAYNADMPFDKFVVRQLAGDLLEQDRDDLDNAEKRDNLIATQMLCLEAKEMDPIEGMVEVVGQHLLGISLNCAKCHDHKFDPYTQKDYYALAGIFTSSRISLSSDRRKGTARDPVRPDALLTALVEGKVGDTHLLNKGDRSQRGPLVPRRFPLVLAGKDQRPISGRTVNSGRLELARWIASAENPLTARVAVNRIWQHLVGRAIVPTPNDFGTQGDPPTHPELLDYLARRFVAGGWSTKALIREIVTSRTYRQAREASPETMAKDPDNELFSRAPARRLQYEQIVDTLLAVSGRLETTPPVLPRPKKNKRDGLRWKPSEDPCHRALYWRDGRLEAQFDAASPELLVPVRSASVTAPQMLFFLNNREVVYLAGRVAQRASAATEQEDVASRIGSAYRLLFARSPNSSERRVGERFVAKHGFDRYCHTLLCANEFLYLD